MLSRDFSDIDGFFSVAYLRKRSPMVLPPAVIPMEVRMYRQLLERTII